MSEKHLNRNNRGHASLDLLGGKHDRLWISKPQMCRSSLTLGQNVFAHTHTQTHTQTHTHTHISISASSSRKATVGCNLGLSMKRMTTEGALEIVPERDVETVATEPSTQTAVCVAALMRGSRCLFLHLVDSICFLPRKSQSFFL